MIAVLLSSVITLSVSSDGNNNGSGSCEASNGNSNRCGSGDTYVTNNTYVTKNITKRFITRNVDRSTNVTEEYYNTTSVIIDDVIARRVGAISAALNAMPFKDDSMEVGFGQYSGVSAISIGAQKRLSERVTGRINISATEGDAVFGAGIGYEL